MTRIAKIFRIFFDIIIFLIVCFAEFAIHSWYKQHTRGFFCDDESLKYPYRENTISLLALIIIVLLVPTLVIVAIESFKQLKSGTKGRTILRIKNIYKQFGYYLFGLALIIVATDIVKFGVGRLRPNFFTICEPEMPDGTTCADPINHGRYITDYTCVGVFAHPNLVREIKRSFPSGHSSLIFFASMYLCLYLQTTLSNKFSKLLKHLLQFVCFMFAVYVALTRIADYWHHWSDVLVGSLLGISCATFTAVFIADLFKRQTGNSSLTKSAERSSSATIATIESVSSAATVSGAHNQQKANKTAQTVLPAYTFGTMPYLHATHPYNAQYQNYGYVP